MPLGRKSAILHTVCLLPHTRMKYIGDRTSDTKHAVDQTYVRTENMLNMPQSALHLPICFRHNKSIRTSPTETPTRKYCEAGACACDDVPRSAVIPLVYPYTPTLGMLVYCCTAVASIFTTAVSYRRYNVTNVPGGGVAIKTGIRSLTSDAGMVSWVISSVEIESYAVCTSI